MYYPGATFQCLRDEIVADICLIYARSTKAVVKALHDVLSKRYSVWWDQDIHAGIFRTEIERELRLAKCVIPVWSGASRDNLNVWMKRNIPRDRGFPCFR